MITRRFEKAPGFRIPGAGKVITSDRLAGFEITAHEFKIWFRKPRSKKRRIRNKWMKDQRNWKHQPRVCYRLGNHILCSLDVLYRLRDEFNTFDPKPAKRGCAEQPLQMISRFGF